MFWFHNSSLESTDFKLAAERPGFYDGGNWFGPFNTLGECKQDAIEYHQTDVHSARGAIQSIRAMTFEQYKKSNK